ncbi:NAD(P)-dependent oxidoreductase [Ramlibacter sp. G-1-2-2]|uniref:NAD(P)-dependent oxidoreductase n=1 Tax=Ramlibacter agri TaxID=2728837 RepID=A0A848HBJ7_9BURK|nr:NAD(P)-dependent oxidoreductase [Ramlibacter agri]NML47422.1 NAD(P)-dependent oxidoreductase [Ramlibacter agri]
MSPLPRIGWLGLGNMGVPMARRLLRAGFAVTAYDPAAPAQTLATLEGFRRADGAAPAVTDADVVVLMLPSSAVVDAVLWGADGIASHMKAGALLVDMGSSDPRHSQENARKLAALGISFLDAPVSGGIQRADDGGLSIMVGGSDADLATARPLLEHLGKTITLVGATGAGHAVKALNNFVSAAGLIAASEALVAAEAFGIDPARVNGVFNVSSARNTATESKVQCMLSGRYDFGFALALMRKDLATAAGLVQAMGIASGISQSVLQVASAAEAALQRGADQTAIHAYLKEGVRK